MILAAGTILSLLFYAGLSMKIDRRCPDSGNSSLLLVENRIKLTNKATKKKRGNTMCEFEGICVYEDCDECDKSDPSQCQYWVIMMGEIGD